MSSPGTLEQRPAQRKALVAVDLGAESCRVSLLRWFASEPRIELVHRIPNGPLTTGTLDAQQLLWPLDAIVEGVTEGLRRAAALAPEGIQSVAVDGWAVDYVRLDEAGVPLRPPFCYRDGRNVAAKAVADTILPETQLFARTGARPLAINTLYQLMADQRASAGPGGVPIPGIARAPWLFLPEYLLSLLGGRRVAEYTNATHSGLVDLETGDWSRVTFDQLGLDIAAAAPIVASGTSVGRLRGDLARLPAYADTELLAPACHDTASAIAAISLEMEDTAYIVSGTWSLVGTTVPRPITSAAALHASFTNQGAASGGYLFHSNVNGMWILKQCVDQWRAQGRQVEIPELVRQAGAVAETSPCIDVDAAPMLLAGEMPARINAQLLAMGAAQIADQPGNEPAFARLIFTSLAHRYAAVLKDLASLTGRRFERIILLGGGSRNVLLSRLAAQTTGLPVVAGEAEGSTLGNFAVQLAAHSSSASPGRATFNREVRDWAARLGHAQRS